MITLHARKRPGGTGIFLWPAVCALAWIAVLGLMMLDW